jgi:hypothetical protein
MVRMPSSPFSHGLTTLGLAGLGILLLSCATSGPFVADTTEKIPAAASRENSSADDVFMRRPWELWQVPNGTARYHRGTHLLLRNEYQDFRATDVSVYAADGSDVRLDYTSVDLGSGSQSRVTISVFVYRAPASLDEEWQSIGDRMRRTWPNARAADPFPVPDRFPHDTRQEAIIAPGRAGGSATYVQTTLFHSGEWAARYEITCDEGDIPVVRKKAGAFLRDLRYKE